VSIVNKLKELNIILPKAPKPVGAYVPFKIVNKFVYISGQLPIDPQGELLKGKIGKQLNLEDGRKAAYLCCLNIISQLNSACENNLETVKNCIKITGYVNSTEDFNDQPKIINAASELIANIFEEKGKHTRAAVSVNSLPLGASVEIDAIFEIK
jgi:enamine deaminase RidA (YjgF/YER057c/UK114 family)